MSYILRFTQTYRPENRVEFLALEAKFEALEQNTPGLPKGRRTQPVAAPEPNHTLIWECEFPTMMEVEQALAGLGNDATHTELFAQQSPYITSIQTSIFEVLKF